MTSATPSAGEALPPDGWESLPKVHLRDENGKPACGAIATPVPEDGKVGLCEDCRLIARDWDDDETDKLRYDIERGLL